MSLLPQELTTLWQQAQDAQWWLLSLCLAIVLVAALLLSRWRKDREQRSIQQRLEQQRQALRSLNEIAALPTLNTVDRLKRALELGCQYLAMDIGIISQIEGQDYRILAQHSPDNQLTEGQQFELGTTYCVLTLQHEDVLAIEYMGQSRFSGHPCYASFKLESYIGVALIVNEQRYGTLNFSASTPRSQPFDETDIEFIRLMGRWIGGTVTRWDMEQERSRMLERFNKLTWHLPGAVYQYQLSADGREWFPYASQGIQDLYGVSPSEARDSAASIIDAIHPDDRERVSASIQASAASGNVWREEYRVNHPRMGELWLSGHATPEALPNGDRIWHGFITDITAQVRTTQALEQSQARFRAMVSNLPGAVYRCSSDADWTMSYLSEEISSITGYPATDFIDSQVRSYASIVHPDDLHRTYKAVEQISKQQVFELSYRVIHAKGHEVWVREKGRGEYNDQGNLQWLSGFIWDATEQHRIDQLKSQFVSTVSHELRTPLTAISGAVTLLANGVVGPVPAEMRPMLQIAQNNSRLLNSLIKDLLDMEKLEAGKMHFNLTPQPLTPLLLKAVEDNSSYAEQFQVSLEAGHMDEVEVLVDSQRLGQIFNNYLSNAIKFSHPGQRVLIESYFENAHVRITVTDQGVGIAEDFHPEVFSKFAQADATDTRQRGGTGLGLAICRELAERMGGEVGFSSTVGVGSSFWITLNATSTGDGRQNDLTP